VGPPALTETTIRYLFATSWLPCDPSGYTVASAAALVATKGRLFRKVVISDEAAVESLRERHDDLRAARGAYLDAEPDLPNAAMADCLQTVADAYQPSLGD
jgi:hypothetical protein